MNDAELLRAYEPVVRFNEGELFFPAAAEDYLACCELVERSADGPAVVVVACPTCSAAVVERHSGRRLRSAT